MAQEILMTQEGFEELNNELYVLKTVRRKEISEKIKVARGFGDLSENSEYDEAKNEQAIVEARIIQLEEQLKNVKIVDKDKLNKDIISVGSRVKILDMDFDEETEYRIVSPVETSSRENTITDESPVGKALLGHKKGDIVEVKAPAGSFTIKVVSVDV